MARSEDQAVAVLAQLQLIVLSSKQMQAYAEAEEWDRLISEDVRRLQLQAVLQSCAWPDDSWQARERERATDLLQQILACNAAIELHAGAWRDELRSILAEARISTRVSSAYASNSGA
ncbi:MAG: Flagellar protein FliT [Pseudomonadota bacterium]|jgi:hypothetical protein|nr:Flagellar protein FliT [Pseudomonadota bacterium]